MKTSHVIIFILVAFGLLLSSIAGCMVIEPNYNVWKQQKEGEALLAHAQSAKEVAVAEARAKNESAVLLAEAEVSRAHGVAKANEIIGNSLKNNQDYLRYLFIMGLENKNMSVIYVPTEANLPILEANRLK